MFGLIRLAEATGGVLGQGGTDIRAGAALEQLTGQTHGPSGLDEFGEENVLTLLAENGINPSRMSIEQLSTLAEELGTWEELPELFSQFTDRAA